MTSKSKPRGPHKPAKKPGVAVPEKIFKLRIEKVPEPLWGKNLRSEEVGLGKHRWDKLRKMVLEDNGPACSICGDTEKPHGHEVWEYHETEAGSCVAKLLKIEIICRRCHDVHHWGNTLRMLDQGLIGRDAVEALQAHFQRVNNCTEADFRHHTFATTAEHQRRSGKIWDIDWGEFTQLVADATANRAARRSK